MSISAYYNEFDPKAAAWLRQLIKNGNITPGEVDERSIEEVRASDLVGFDRVHWFSGIGTWDYCLNQSGWGGKPVWTASLPCQPFSTAGKGLGKSDERHLLPHFLELVRQCKPDTIFGEQVEAAIKHGWLDDLQTNMEAEGYAVGHCVLGAHSIGAAHIRQRLYWVADNSGARSQRREGAERTDKQFIGQDCLADGMANTESSGSKTPSAECYEQSSEGSPDAFAARGGVIRMGDTEHNGRIASEIKGSTLQTSSVGREEGEDIPFESKGASRPCPATDLSGREERQGIDWIYCRDNKYRPVKSGIKPLVNGIARGVVHSWNPGESINANETQEARVMRLKGYGNAIQAQTAIAFISAYMSI
ncbi:DNA cytosine methyltransferase [Nitrosomonas sp.]|uniref:DNA cytosine methyltransferase n=1 Tax=Nitrosomonas sp. TaxID=42353 RepID=UPI0025DC80D9|nr:DNA cytosine methyltransferase [Nitrosomonas sp.]MBY0484588.1 DNA cytosine methyltransferase [Nitrosomonas sp.]